MYICNVQHIFSYIRPLNKKNIYINPEINLQNILKKNTLKNNNNNKKCTHRNLKPFITIINFSNNKRFFTVNLTKMYVKQNSSSVLYVYVYAPVPRYPLPQLLMLPTSLHYRFENVRLSIVTREQQTNVPTKNITIIHGATNTTKTETTKSFTYDGRWHLHPY